MENKCTTLQGIIDFATSRRKNSHETIIESLVSLFHENGEKNYNGSRILGRLKDNQEHGGTDLKKALSNYDFKNFIITYSKYNKILKLALDEEFINTLIKKSGLKINTPQDLIAYYINPNHKSQQPLIDFALQNPDIINNTEIDQIHHIDNQIVTENLLVEGNIEYQWFSQDPINKVFTLQSSITKAPFEKIEDVLIDMKKEGGADDREGTFNEVEGDDSARDE